jgi:hypothetical protein
MEIPTLTDQARTDVHWTLLARSVYSFALMVFPRGIEPPHLSMLTKMEIGLERGTLTPQTTLPDRTERRRHPEHGCAARSCCHVRLSDYPQRRLPVFPSVHYGLRSATAIIM